MGRSQAEENLARRYRSSSCQSKSSNFGSFLRKSTGKDDYLGKTLTVGAAIFLGVLAIILVVIAIIMAS